MKDFGWMSLATFAGASVGTVIGYWVVSLLKMFGVVL